MHGDPASAAETIFSENIFGGSCARACPTEVLCEGACVDRTLLKAPVEIGRLQRFATDDAAARDLRFFEPGEDTGKRIAIIGSGPAGMSCAHELRRAGHAVTVFESRSVAGGLNTFGIAAYKISTEFALSELQPILDMGVEIQYDTHVGPERLEKLRAEYDAVFLGVGLGPTASLGIPGEDLDGVWEALDFVFQSHSGPLTDCVVGQRVVVIGAGNTAIDVATQAVRLGADQVTIVYRRTDSEMSAFAYEYDLAKADQVEFVWQVQPVGFVGSEGRLAAVSMERVTSTSDGRTGALSVVGDSRFEIQCDMAIKALGQTPVLALVISLDGAEVSGGRLIVDLETGSTGAEGVFAGGDCVNGGSEIVDAVQAGKVAARGIDAYVRR